MKKWSEKLLKNASISGKSFQGRGHKLGGGTGETPSSSHPQSKDTGGVRAPVQQQPQSRTSRTDALVDSSIASIGDVECESAMRHIVQEKDHGVESLKTIHRILSNIIQREGDEKVRKLRLQNPKIQSCIVDVPGGMELLLGCGFEVVFEPSSANEGGEDGFLMLPKMEKESSSFALLVKIRRAIGIVLGLPQGDDGNAPVRVSQSEDTSTVLVDRNTILELPTPVDTCVPEWFFEQSSAEIKQLYRENRAKLEQSKVLMTKAMREKLLKRNTKQSSVLRIRVRAPEGTKIVGDFHRGEPVQALVAWVADCLVDPMLEFDLIMPDRSKLGDARFELKTLAQLGLTESQTMNLAWMGDSVHQMKHRPAFRENL